MTDIAEQRFASRSAWGAEVRATLALAWPLILINLSNIALGTTDVIMMGWLGPDALAAGALATNLNFAFLIFGIGLVTATSPLIAIELGRKRHSVRDVRRSVRQGIWAAVAIARADLGDPLERRVDHAPARAGAARSPTRRRPISARSNGASCRSSPSSCCAISSRRWSGRSPRSGSAGGDPGQRGDRLLADVRRPRHCRRSVSRAPGSARR